MSNNTSSLDSDKPLVDPTKDLFGHATFAKALAIAVSGYQSSDGIVLALYGPWGSGKSTVLGFVEHELEKLPVATRPVTVTFNPWWFSGHENLARAFLSQMEAVLPAKHAGFKKLGEKLNEFSGAIGTAADILGAKVGVPGAGKVASAAIRLFKPKPKPVDVPALKQSISKLLLQETKRILVIVDDIDRLHPEEVRQLFTVIKALADFPYVTYLLAFDKEVASQAIEKQMGLPGERFLEKIIQVPFELPMVDRTSLRKALFSKLDAVMSGSKGNLDVGHWQNIYFAGLDQLFTVPRHLIRLTNALSVTYPSVAGEVNPVDFIAIECIRVFLPGLYEVIRSSPEEFTGFKAPEQHEKQRALAFHNAWLAKIPEHLREGIKDLMERLFPRLESVWSNMHYSGDSLKEWRKELRVCAGGDIFAAYFRLALPAGAVSQAEVSACIAAASNADEFAQQLRAAARQKTPTGVTKARGLLERLSDHIEELSAHAGVVLAALLTVGDELILPGDIVPASFDFGNESRVTRMAYRLLEKLPQQDRLPALTAAFLGASAARCAEFLLSTLEERAQKAAQGQGDCVITSADVETLKPLWLALVKQLAATPNLIEHPRLAGLLGGWRHWGDPQEAKAWAQQATQADAALIKLVSAFASQSSSQVWGDFAVKLTWKVNPKSLEPYVDLEPTANRLQTLSDAGIADEKDATVVKAFLRQYKKMQAGEPIGDLDDDDDDGHA
jgi:predicted KAP-like P-loop ATPase